MLILYIEKHAICLKDYRIRSFLNIQYVHGDLCKHLGIDSSTDHPDLYSNLIMSLEGSCFFFKIKGDSMTGQVRAHFHCDLRFSQIEKNLKSQF